jgi:hypothetical protein
MGAFFGFLFIAGLFAAYALQERDKKRQAERADAPPQQQPVVAEPVAAVERPVSQGSPNWGAPILFTGLLIAAATHRDSWWGVFWQVPYFALMAVAAYSTFHPKEIAEEQRRRPGTTRRDVFIRTGIPYLIIPLIAWTVTIPAGLNAGALIAAVPWILLAIIGMVVVAFRKNR